MSEPRLEFLDLKWRSNEIKESIMGQILTQNPTDHDLEL